MYPMDCPDEMDELLSTHDDSQTGDYGTFMSIGDGNGYAVPEDYETFDQFYGNSLPTTRSPSLGNKDYCSRRADLLVDPSAADIVLPDDWNLKPAVHSPNETTVYYMNFQQYGGEPKSWTGWLGFEEHKGTVTLIGDEEVRELFPGELRVHAIPPSIGRAGLKEPEGLGIHERGSKRKYVSDLDQQPLGFPEKEDKNSKE